MRTRRPVLSLLAGALAAAVLVPLVPAAWAQEADPSTTTAEPTGTATAGATPTATPTATMAPPAVAPVLRLTTSVTQVVAGENVVLTGRATRPDGTAVAGEVLEVVARTGGTTTRTVVGRLTTGASGTGTFTWKPRTSSELQLRRTAAPAATSDRRVVHVQPRLTAAVTPASVTVGSAAVLRGALAPAYAGVRLQVQRRRADGSWYGVATVGASSTGAYAWTLRPGTTGRVVLRTVLPATMAHRGVATPAVALTVLADPTLRQGDRGSAVAVLERRLAALKADVGRMDGVYDTDLRHAVTAFQKTQGLPRTGVYDARTRTRMASPLPVRLRHPSAGRAVEVDLVKQVLYLSQGGVLQRVVDISSGNDQPYTVDGVTYRAFTPTGRFTIQRKIDGIRVSRLGELYRPAYFHQGWAVHGSPSVPTYPASHGCIRVTNSAMDRLFPLLTIGVPVAVYR